MDTLSGSPQCILVNGKSYEVPRDCNPDMSLNDFLREVLELKGTKVLCREAGCGCCMVTASYLHPKTGKVVTNPVTSCLCPVYSAVGWNVTTIEGLGGQRDKDYHPIQERLAERYGSQCGYCSPGFVMSMFAGLNNNPKPNSEQVEHFFDGNICRCTGYRPILDAMKTFAVDSKDPQACCLDIEDLQKVCCKDKLAKVITSGLIPIAKGWKGQRFYNPGKLEELLTLLGRHKDDNLRLVFGNTSAGVFKDDAIAAEVYINTRNVPELYKNQQDNECLELGANTSLNELIRIFAEVGKQSKGLKHLVQVGEHLQQVANQAVRSSGCWAGNLMIKHAHPEFPSDVFILLEASRAVLVVSDHSGSQRDYRLVDFLQEDMRGRVILSVKLPFISTEQHVFRSYKITPRALNAHAYVNAAFHFRLDETNKRRVTEHPSIVIGGISGKFHHAVKTENFLQNKCLDDEKTVKEAAQVLEGEIVPLEEVCSSTPEHRRRLASNLLYKFVRGEAGRQRFVVHGEQDYEEVDNAEVGAPLGKAMPKQEAKAQTSGQAMYSNDYPAHKNELFASFVLSPEAPVKVKGFVTKEAEAVPGYVRLVTAKDIDSWGFLNDKATVMVPEQYRTVEEILASENVIFAGQPVAVVLANSQSTADRCAKLVEFQYESNGEPIVDIRDAMIKNSVLSTFPPVVIGEDVDKAMEASAFKAEGELTCGEQFHFHIEPITASVDPTEEGLIVTLPHQWLDGCHGVLSHALRIPANKIRIVSPRIGGSFGGKFFNADHAAVICAMIAYSLNKPVRMYMTLEKNLEFGMKRPTFLFKYKAGADKSGKLQALDWEIFSDDGFAMNVNAEVSAECSASIDGSYFCPNYKITRTMMKTNKNLSTFTRGPGPIPASIATITMMNHLASVCKIDPVEFKKINLYEDGQMGIHERTRLNDNFQEMWRQIETKAEIAKRRKEIEDFNKNNKFRKRGLDVSGSSYHLSFVRANSSTVAISVQGSDGTVNVAHSGSEMGQGIGLKVAQTVSAGLGISIDLIKLKPTDSYLIPNCDFTGGSVTSELNVQAAIIATQKLNEALKPFREKSPEATWQQIIGQAAGAGVTLHVIGGYQAQNEPGTLGRYYSTGTGAAEVELDCLTGEYFVRRVDIVMDLGRSLNPGVDIGQIEGSFVMGMGYCLVEKTVYSEDDGRLESRGTWNYKVPQAADIPRDFRVHLLRDSNNPRGILSTKGVGEPPMCLSAVTMTALLHAVEAWRVDRGKPAVAHPGKLDLPLTPDRVLTDLLQVQPEDRCLN